MLDSLAVAALQGCDGKIKEHVQDLVQPAASSGLAEQVWCKRGWDKNALNVTF